MNYEEGTTMQQTWKRVQGFFKSEFLWWGFVFLGIALRLRQYLLNNSLSGDEAGLAVNLVNRNFLGLTQLLDYHQAAPVGFLFIEKLLIVIFGNHDYVLSLFPLFTGCLAVYLIYKLARTSFGTFGLFAVLMFSISWWLVVYSSILKQYISDTMVVLALVYLAINCLREHVRAKDFLTLGIVGFLGIWISHPSVFILAGIGLVLVLEKFTRKEYVPWIWILGIGIGWVASFGLEYLVSLRHIVADDYLINYWRRAYVPLPPWSDKGWFVDTYFSFLLFAFHRADGTMALIALVFTFIGTVTVLIRDWRIGLLVISPLVIAVIVSALQRYPLKDRFMLFLIPFVFLLMSEGFRGIYWLIAKWRPNFAAVFSGILVLAIVWQIVPVTYERATSGISRDIRSVIKYVAENRMQDDIVYVFDRTNSVFHYYAPFYGLDEGNIVIGVYSPKKKIEQRNFENDVVNLIGNSRVWFIFSEILDCTTCLGEGTQASYVDYLDKFGVMLDIYDGSGGNAYLYDLSP